MISGISKTVTQLAAGALVGTLLLAVRCPEAQGQSAERGIAIVAVRDHEVLTWQALTDAKRILDRGEVPGGWSTALFVGTEALGSLFEALEATALTRARDRACWPASLSRSIASISSPSPAGCLRACNSPRGGAASS